MFYIGVKKVNSLRRYSSIHVYAPSNTASYEENTERSARINGEFYNNSGTWTHYYIGLRWRKTLKFEAVAVETSKQTEERFVKWDRKRHIQGLGDKFKMFNILIVGLPKGEKQRARNIRNMWNNNDWELPPN